MAARLHVDTAINERRLRPIYDSLDNGNNKKALSEAEKVLKKQKDFLCAKALKALALVRLGKRDEAFTVVQEVHMKDATEDSTLQAMTMCYKELQKFDLIAEAYARATKKDPHNEELLSHLFMSYVRIGDYKKQQQTAMALYKLKPKNPYYFWAVMSIVMQAEEADEKLARAMLLPLAERMTEKFVNEDKLEAEAEVLLYIMILEKQEKYGKALEVLDGPLLEKITLHQDVVPKRAQFLAKLQRWPEANFAFKKLLLGNPDQWYYYLEYFNSVCQLVDGNWKPEENSLEESNNSTGVDLHLTFDSTFDKNHTSYTFEMAADFIEALVEEQNGVRDGRKLRGPYLAQIKLLDELLKRENPVAKRIGSMVDVLTRFFEHFGTKPSCFIDLSHVIKTISLKEEDIRKVLENIETKLKGENLIENHFSNDLREMNQHLCYSRLHHYYSYHEDLDLQQKLTYTEELLHRYNDSLKFGKDLLSTEFQPADNYCLLAAHVLINIWEKSGDESIIIQLLVLLANGLNKSPSNYQMKLLLLKLYNVIGAAGASFLLFDSIEVKHVQQETLGYLVTESLPAAAFYHTFGFILESSIRFYTSNYKDIVEYLLSGYKYGSFTKIPELVDFREKINNSLQYATLTVERMILDILLDAKSYGDSDRIITNMEIDPENDHRPTETLVDSRDIFIYRMYTEKEKNVLEEFFAKSRQEKIWWLKIRNLTLRILAASMSLHKSSHTSDVENNITNGVKKHMTDILSDLITSLKDCLMSIDKGILIKSVFPLQFNGECRLYKYLHNNHCEALLSFAKLVLRIHGLVENYSIETSESKEDLEIVNNIRNYIKGSFDRIQETNSKRCSLKPSEIKGFLEDFSHTVETFSFGTIFLSICHTLLKPALAKKAKKKKESSVQISQEVFEQITALAGDMVSTGNSLYNMLNEIEPSQLASSLNIDALGEITNFIKEMDDIKLDVINKVEHSYQTSLKELGDLLNSKIKYLQLLAW